MSRSATRSSLKYFLQGLSSVSFAIAGLSFFFGGRAIHEFGGVDRTLAEVIGLGLAFVCGAMGWIAKSKIGNIEWEEQNEDTARDQDFLKKKMNQPRL